MKTGSWMEDGCSDVDALWQNAFYHCCTILPDALARLASAATAAEVCLPFWVTGRTGSWCKPGVSFLPSPPCGVLSTIWITRSRFSWGSEQHTPHTHTINNIKQKQLWGTMCMMMMCMSVFILSLSDSFLFLTVLFTSYLILHEEKKKTTNNMRSVQAFQLLREFKNREASASDS